MKYALIAALLILPGSAFAACYAPIPPAACTAPSVSTYRYSGNYGAASAAYQNCLEAQEQYQELIATYNQCVARENLSSTGARSCEETAPLNGTARMAGESCRIYCNEGYYLTKDQRCVAKTVRTPEPAPQPAPDPEPAPTVETPKPVMDIISAPVFNILKKPTPAVSQEKPAEEGSETVEAPASEPAPEAPAPRPWWHWFNPFNWF